MKLVDMLVLGTSAALHVGSSPTKGKNILFFIVLLYYNKINI